MSLDLNYKVLTLVQSDEWSNLLRNLDADVYFSPEYHSVFEKFGDGKACCFVFENENGIYLRPYFMNSVNELGYVLDKQYFDIQSVYGYTGPLASTLDSNFLTEAMNCFEASCKSAGIIAGFTRFHPLLNNQTYFAHNPIVDRGTVKIDLNADFESVWKSQFTGNARNMIRKAIKLGYMPEVVQNPNETQIGKFIELYSGNMAKVSANEYFFFDNDFFYNSFKFLRGKIILVNILDSSRSCMASSMFLASGKFLHYHLSGRSSTADNSVNSLAIETAVKFGIEHKFSLIHLGGGRTNADDDSLLKFKKSFSAHQQIFSIEKKIYNEPVYTEVVKQWQNAGQRSPALNNVLLKYRM